MSDVLNKTLNRDAKKGTLDFITKLKQLKLLNDFKLLSLDIESLFPSIPLDETLKLVTDIFLENGGQNLNRAEILRSFKFCTKNTTFKFEDFCYKQINGVRWDLRSLRLWPKCF